MQKTEFKGGTIYECIGEGQCQDRSIKPSLDKIKTEIIRFDFEFNPLISTDILMISLVSETHAIHTMVTSDHILIMKKCIEMFERSFDK